MYLRLKIGRSPRQKVSRAEAFLESGTETEGSLFSRSLWVTNCLFPWVFDPLQPCIQLPQRQIALHLVPRLPITNFPLQLRQKVKRDVRRLKFLGISIGDVVHQRPQSGRPWRRNRSLSRD